MYKSFRTARFMVAAALMAAVSVSASAAVIKTDGLTTSKDVSYKSEYTGDILTLTIDAFGATGNLAGSTHLRNLVFSSMKPAGKAGTGFFLNDANIIGANPVDGHACNGSNGGGSVCFDDLAGKIEMGAPLIYKIAFDYAGSTIDFDNFTMKATFTHDETRIVKGKPVTTLSVDSDTVQMNAAEVPEPASLAMLGAGLGLIGFTRRRKTAQA